MANDSSQLLSNLNWFTIISQPTISIFGITGNVLSVLVFMQHSFRRLSINRLLMALSASDLLLLLIGAPTMGLGSWSAIDVEHKGIENLHAVSVVYVFPVINMLHCFSVWMLTLITIERWLAVCRPLLVSTYCTKSRAIYLILLTALASVTLNVVRFYDFKLIDGQLVPLFYHQDPGYMFWYHTVTYLALIYVIPLTVVVTMNTLIVLRLVETVRHRRNMTSMDFSERATSKMMVYLIISFILCYSSSFVLTLVEVFMPGMFFEQLGHALNDLNNTLVFVNCSINFCFYYHFSSRFRHASRRILSRFCPCCCHNMISRSSTTALPVTPRRRSCLSVHFNDASYGTVVFAADVEIEGTTV